jgi:hypothetical protein
VAAVAQPVRHQEPVVPCQHRFRLSSEGLYCDAGALVVDVPPFAFSAFVVVELADLRNHIVHNGYSASRDDALGGVESADKLIAFVEERVLEAADRRPRAALMILGEPAIRRAGRWTPRVQAVAGLDRLDDFHKWRNAALAAYEARARRNRTTDRDSVERLDRRPSEGPDASDR